MHPTASDADIPRAVREALCNQKYEELNLGEVAKKIMKIFCNDILDEFQLDNLRVYYHGGDGKFKITDRDVDADATSRFLIGNDSDSVDLLPLGTRIGLGMGDGLRRTEAAATRSVLSPWRLTAALRGEGTSRAEEMMDNMRETVIDFGVATRATATGRAAETAHLQIQQIGESDAEIQQISDDSDSVDLLPLGTRIGLGMGDGLRRTEAAATRSVLSPWRLTAALRGEGTSRAEEMMDNMRETVIDFGVATRATATGRAAETAHLQIQQIGESGAEIQQISDDSESDAPEHDEIFMTAIEPMLRLRRRLQLTSNAAERTPRIISTPEHDLPDIGRLLRGPLLAASLHGPVSSSMLPASLRTVRTVARTRRTMVIAPSDRVLRLRPLPRRDGTMVIAPSDRVLRPRPLPRRDGTNSMEVEAEASARPWKRRRGQGRPPRPPGMRRQALGFLAAQEENLVDVTVSYAVEREDRRPEGLVSVTVDEGAAPEGRNIVQHSEVDHSEEIFDAFGGGDPFGSPETHEGTHPPHPNPLLTLNVSSKTDHHEAGAEPSRRDPAASTEKDAKFAVLTTLGNLPNFLGMSIYLLQEMPTNSNYMIPYDECVYEGSTIAAKLFGIRVDDIRLNNQSGRIRQEFEAYFQAVCRNQLKVTFDGDLLYLVSSGHDLREDYFTALNISRA